MNEQVFNIEFNGYWRDVNLLGLPSKSGVFCVYECAYNKDENTVTLLQLIYIDDADNINYSLANHERRSDWQALVRNGNELCYSFADVEPNNRSRIKAALIFCNKPKLNSEYLNSFPFDTTTINASGRTAFLKPFFTVDKTLV